MKSTVVGPAAKPRKSPLRAQTMPRLARDLVADPEQVGRRHGRSALSAADIRQMTISEFTAWQGGQTNKQDRPARACGSTAHAGQLVGQLRVGGDRRLDQDLGGLLPLAGLDAVEHVVTKCAARLPCWERNLTSPRGWLPPSAPSSRPRESGIRPRP